ncbi:hypothetical protein ABID56_001755 [Alkalibacillus flavidus]|uniref:Homeodomain phBC6A51-type domain-containing protein n=1 Tax=Alkalibacillus flavidus TaxID=546021 RepID=A0ABV2KVN6_9BACI
MTDKPKDLEKAPKPAELANGELTVTTPKGDYQLNSTERYAAALMAQNDMNLKGNRLSIGELADAVDINVRTLYNWRSNPEFQRYRNDIVTLALDDAQAKAAARLIEMAEGKHTGTPSMKAIELVFKLNGKLSDKHEHYYNGPQQNEKVDVQDLDDIIEQYADEGDGNDGNTRDES